MWPALLWRQVWWMSALIIFSFCLHTSGQLRKVPRRRRGNGPTCSIIILWSQPLGGRRWGQGPSVATPVLTKQSFLVLHFQQQPVEQSNTLLARVYWRNTGALWSWPWAWPSIATSITVTTTSQIQQDVLACSFGASLWGAIWFFIAGSIIDWGVGMNWC